MPEGKKRIWTVRELMKSAIEFLAEKGFDEARLNSELLLAHALHMERIQIYTSFDKPLDDREVAEFRSLFERRLKHEPLQYITGSTSFMGLQFGVNPSVLIPRPETETLIEEAVAACRKFPAEKRIEILDIGTGSGNIAVAVVKFVKNAHVTTVDISEPALECARENARFHHVDDRIDFFQMDILQPIDIIKTKKYDFLLSNPPYVAQRDWEALQPEIVKYEPQNAVTDHADGLTFYKRIAGIASELLTEEGVVMVEVGYGQAGSVENIFAESGFKGISIVKDMQNVPRVLCGQKRIFTPAAAAFSAN
jgi:release factor glutamine methyltransferase